MFTIAAITIIWLIGAYVNTGFALAQTQSIYPAGAKKSYREDLGICWMLNLIPLFWVIVPFLTGFYEHGWMKPTLTNPNR